VLTLDALNHPILAWAEMESYRFTGDTRRLGLVYEPLTRYYRALETYIQQGNGLFMTDWASMDNSPRNPHLRSGGCGIDISCEMVLFARNLATMARVLGKPKEADRFREKAEQTARRINRLMWNERKRFYFDLTQAGEQAPVKTIAAFWALLAQVASPDQARSLAAELNNPNTFARLHRVPTLSADEKAFNPQGGYWCGAVWAPTTTMVIRGLENYGQEDLAREIALNHLDIMGRVFRQTGTVWENYAPDTAAPGKPAKKDFVGWSGIGPILYLLEYAIGLKPDAPRNELTWVLSAQGRLGCERFRFNGHVVSLQAEPVAGGTPGHLIKVASDGTFTLRLVQGEQRRTVEIRSGEQQVSFP